MLFTYCIGRMYFKIQYYISPITDNAYAGGLTNADTMGQGTSWSRIKLHNIFCLFYKISIIYRRNLLSAALMMKSLIIIWAEYFLHFWRILWSSSFLELNVQFISYLKCSNWRRILKLSSKSCCLFTFCYLDGAEKWFTYL